MPWHYFTGLSGSNDISLGFAVASDTVYRWHVTNTGKAFEISGKRWKRLGWFAPLDNVSGDPTLPDGLYQFSVQFFESINGLGVTNGITLDEGIGDIHVECFTGVVLDFAIFTP